MSRDLSIQCAGVSACLSAYIDARRNEVTQPRSQAGPGTFFDRYSACRLLTLDMLDMLSWIGGEASIHSPVVPALDSNPTH